MTRGDDSSQGADATLGSLLADLHQTLQEQLRCVQEGLLDQAAEACRKTEQLLNSLRRTGVAGLAGQAELNACRRLHEQVGVALAQQQGEVVAELARVRPGKVLLQAYGAGAACGRGGGGDRV